MESRAEDAQDLAVERELTRAEVLRQLQAERRLAKAKVRAAVRRGRGTMPSAREWFGILRPRLLASRPVVGETKTGEPIYGAPTFRNRITEDGEHV